MNATLRLARAELRKLFTTRALPVSLAIAIVLAVSSVIIDAMVAGRNGQPRLGTDASIDQMLKFGAVTCVVMLITGILAAGSEFRHRTIIPALLATPRRSRIFAVKVAVVAAVGAAVGAVVFGLGLVAIVVELSAHGIHHLPAGAASLYVGTVISSASPTPPVPAACHQQSPAWCSPATPSASSRWPAAPPSGATSPNARRRLTQGAGHPVTTRTRSRAAVSAGTHPVRYQFPAPGSGRMADLEEEQSR